MIGGILRVHLGLLRVLFALGVIILAMRLGSGAMRLRRILVVLGCLVVSVFHLISPADKFG
jgi:hypothetical protein